jgi:hypothetical protein
VRPIDFAVRQDALRLVGVFRVRQAIAGYGVLPVGSFLMLSVIRVYSGAGWASDWVEDFLAELTDLCRKIVGTAVPNDWINRKTGESKLRIKEMGSRYLFIVLYCFIEKWLSRGDYHSGSGARDRDANLPAAVHRRRN